MSQIHLISLELLVSPQHNYRKFLEVLDFSIFNSILKEIDNKNGFGSLKLFKCILLQYIEDLSDRELERFLQENNAAKWFCGFEILDKTPDHSSFGKFRNRLGIKRLEKIFLTLKQQLKKQGLMNEFFSVVDATHLITKASLWEERDKAKERKYEKLNNETLPKVAVDKEARIGCKGRNKFWYGYKISRCIDIQSGLLNRTAIFSANVHDTKTLEHVLPEQGGVYVDKGFSSSELEKRVEGKGCVLRAVKKNNAKDKNKDLDKYITKIRAPFERMFSKMRKRARYIGLEKNYFAEIFDCLSFNIKRMLVLKEKGILKTA